MTTPIVERSSSPEEALRTKVQPGSNGCLLWTGWLSDKGYGFIAIGEGKEVQVHRYVWEQANGPIPAGMFVDHRCFSRNCVNVEHLRPATPAQNVQHRSGPTVLNKRSGIRGVYPRRNKWVVHVGHNGRNYYFGSYSTIEEATAVADEKRRELFGAEWAGRH